MYTVRLSVGVRVTLVARATEDVGVIVAMPCEFNEDDPWFYVEWADGSEDAYPGHELKAVQ